MSYKFRFEKLEIWKLAIELSVAIYLLTNSYPSEEKFGLVSQLRRASNSVSANIAEGMSRSSVKEKARFIQIAYGSSIEVLSHLILSEKLGFITPIELEKHRKLIQEITNKINAFYKTLIKE